MTQSGKVTEYVVPDVHVPATQGSKAHAEALQIGGMTTGPDGNVWITEYAYNTNVPRSIVRITPAGKLTRFTAFARGANGLPNQITAGPGKQLFFSVDDTNFDIPGPQFKIGRITTSGRVSFIRLPHGENKQGEAIGADASTLLITGPDGNLWFVNDGGESDGSAVAIDRLTLAGHH
jgi:streptogramin lyase